MAVFYFFAGCLVGAAFMALLDLAGFSLPAAGSSRAAGGAGAGAPPPQPRRPTFSPEAGRG